MSTGQLKQRTAAILSLLALLSALLLGLVRYESSLHPNLVHPTHVAIQHLSDTGSDVMSRHP
jgi:hypothetical protein